MASTSFATRSRAVSYTSAQPALDANANGTANGTANVTRSHTSSLSSDSKVLHVHRQNYNSSKLPAYRFADLKKDRISLTSLHQPSPLSPILSRTSAEPLDHQDTHEQTRGIPASAQNSLHHYSSAQTLPNRPTSFDSQQTGAPTRSRSLKFHLPSTSSISADPSPGSKRPASFPLTRRSSDDVSAARSELSDIANPAAKRRLTESATKELGQGPRELLLRKTVEFAKSDDTKSRPPSSYKQPSTASCSAARSAIPPIRSLRSAGSRKSVVLDAQPPRSAEDSFGEETTGSKQHDRTRQALEGRADEDFSHLAPPDTEMTATTDNDNTADIFMKIAREEPAPRASEKQAEPAEPSAVTRIVRTSHRRPLSAAIPSQEPPSVPQLSRRLSDQRDSSRSRQAADNQPAQQMMRELAYRTSTKDNLPPITTTTEESSRAQSSRPPLRPSPITPRQTSFKDSFAESSSVYQRRRQSLTDNNNLSASRATHYRSNLSVAQGRTYSSSPLVPKSANVQTDVPQHSSDANHGVEGTESSSSTAAPSTVWDELDDLKSRIHRLELTGKMPSTGVTASRSSEERPRTATTNATTVSASPKQASGTGSAPAEGKVNLVLPRETQPLLLSALSKTKDLVKPEVFSAIESAANDALALSSMIGAPGQPGPISSGASTIGGYGGVTDRQLRKKADSICRSLTELCIALAEPTGQPKQLQPPAALEKDYLISPMSNKATVGVITPQRRPSAIAESIAKANTSPRAPTALEQKRQTMLASTSLPSSRYVTAPSTPLEPTAGRKSSLLLSRIRRVATDEQEEAPQAGRRSSLLLRTRRTETEEPEENREVRKTSLLLRTRKTLNLNEEENEPSRVPSRAVTEVNSFRTMPRDLGMNAVANQSPPENMGVSAVLPRRRLIPAAIATRFATAAPSGSAPNTPARKYLERSTLQDRVLPQERSALQNGMLQDRGLLQERSPLQGRSTLHERSSLQDRGLLQERGTPQERGSYLDRGTHQERLSATKLAERLAEEKGQQQRHLGLSQSTLLTRTGSVGRRTRETSIPSLRS
ncbi:hypothetical protein VTI74DRAFT_6513 [Chaetomium olivicolor]